MGANTYDVVGNILEESVNRNKKAKSKKSFLRLV